MNEYGKRGLSIKDKSPKEELLNVTGQKIEGMTDKLSQYEIMKQAIAKETKEAKESFRSKFKEIRIKQDQLKNQQVKDRIRIDSMINNVIEDARKSVAEISKTISGHGSSMNLAEKYIMDAQKKIVDERENMGDCEKKIVKEIKEKLQPKEHGILNTSQKVNATKTIHETKLESPKKPKKPEKHVTFGGVEISKQRQGKDKPRMMGNRHQGYNFSEKSKNDETNVKKEKPQVQKTIKGKKMDRN